MAEAFLIDGTRTPVGRYGGALSAVRRDDLAASDGQRADVPAEIDPDALAEVILATPTAPVRRTAMWPGWPAVGALPPIPGITVNRRRCLRA